MSLSRNATSILVIYKLSLTHGRLNNGRVESKDLFDHFYWRCKIYCIVIMNNI